MLHLPHPPIASRIEAPMRTPDGGRAGFWLERHFGAPDSTGETDISSYLIDILDIRAVGRTAVLPYHCRAIFIHLSKNYRNGPKKVVFFFGNHGKYNRLKVLICVVSVAHKRIPML
jgi:hypothetical protein